MCLYVNKSDVMSRNRDVDSDFYKTWPNVTTASKATVAQQVIIAPPFWLKLLLKTFIVHNRFIYRQAWCQWAPFMTINSQENVVAAHLNRTLNLVCSKDDEKLLLSESP